MESPSLDSVRNVSHRRQPIFKRTERRLSYKIFEEQTFKRILEEHDSLLFKSHALFSNQDEVPDISNMEAEEALEFAKARAKKPVPRPTSRSSMEISMGEGGLRRFRYLSSSLPHNRVRYQILAEHHSIVFATVPFTLANKRWRYATTL